MFARILGVLALALFAVAAEAHEIKLGELVIQHPWARPSIGKAPNGAVFMRIVNKGAKPDRLVSVQTTAAAKAELHTHVHEGDVMRMRPVEAIEVPAGGQVTLGPGGMHVMLFDVVKPLKSGFGVPLTLTFAEAGTVELTAVITQPGQDFKAYGEH